MSHIGIDDFRRLRELGLAYVDRSALVEALVARPGAQVVILQRPPGFGKSLALSLLRCFFERSDEDLRALFEDLAVAEEEEVSADPWAHFQRYPVLHLRLGDLVHERYEDLAWALQEKLRDLIDEHRETLASAALSDLDRDRLGRLLDGSAPAAAYRRALLDLTRALRRATGERVVVLVDDIDQPVIAGALYGYAEAAQGLMRELLGAGLTHNPHLARAVLSCTLDLGDEHGARAGGPALVCAPWMSALGVGGGLAEEELAELMDPDELPSLRRWHGGHGSDDRPRCAPAAVMTALAGGPWRGVGARSPAEALVARLLEHDTERMWPALGPLLGGDELERELPAPVPVTALGRERTLLWSLLCAAGWLRAEPVPSATTEPLYRLQIPNRSARALVEAALAAGRSAAGSQPGRAQAGHDPSEAATEPDELVLPATGGARRPRSVAAQRRPRPDIEHEANEFETRLQRFFTEIREDSPALDPELAPGPDGLPVIDVDAVVVDVTPDDAATGTAPDPEPGDAPA
ncbi:AAA family ATPase [Haliangium sp.]|uniref:AAA family ATPase n=1 Tax=Haliangium sp. TaxID=2663208 RepID=UPI003D0AF17D